MGVPPVYQGRAIRAHPTFKSVGYLILIPYLYENCGRFPGSRAWAKKPGLREFWVW
jgi:hypothetical protein